MRYLALALVLAAPPMTPASAGQAVTEKMTCPIGGAEFNFETTASHSSWGTRPDGKPYGSWTFPPALPECPDNGLVLYKDYDAAEVAKLEPLVASEAYQALRRTDTQYYRAYWLMQQMGVEPERSLLALIRAAWEADAKPELRARYLTEFAEATARLEPKPADINWIGMEATAVDALRETGRFDEALARLDRMPDVSAPPAAPTGEDRNPAAEQARERRNWAEYLAKVRKAIERKDASAEPLDMIPRRIALTRCLDEAGKLDEHGRAFCASEEKAVAAFRASRDKALQEMNALSKPREESGR
ncbi:MAG TPA: hypothetical protein VF727_01995 [Allosphingosinicella sp.]